MKNLYITSTGKIAFDKETNEISPLNSDREGIRSVYLIDEPMHIYYSMEGKNIELDVEPNDILIHFYESTFPMPLVVAKSSDWTNNIRDFRKKEEEMKMKWAEGKSDCEAGQTAFKAA